MITCKSNIDTLMLILSSSHRNCLFIIYFGHVSILNNYGKILAISSKIFQ